MSEPSLLEDTLDRIGAVLELTLDDYLVVRDRLIDFDGTRFQVLSPPLSPLATPPRPWSPRTTSTTTSPR